MHTCTTLCYIHVLQTFLKLYSNYTPMVSAPKLPKNRVMLAYLCHGDGGEFLSVVHPKSCVVHHASSTII